MTKKFIILLAFSSLIFAGCGNDDAKKTTSSSNTDGSTTTPSTTSKGSLTISSALPVQANGDLLLTSVVDAVNPNAFGRIITVLATVNEGYSHEIKIYYSTYILAGTQYGTIQSVIDTWGTDLENPDGISICEANCTQTAIYPETTSIVFNNQYLGTAPEISVIGGVVLYTTKN